MAKRRQKQPPIEILDDGGAGITATSKVDLQDELRMYCEHEARHAEMPSVYFRDADDKVYRATPRMVVEVEIEEAAESDEEDAAVELTIRSDAINRAKYYPWSKQLVVEFPSGSIYSYDEVPPEVVTALGKAKSAGQYFNQHIKDSFTASEAEWDR